MNAQLLIGIIAGLGIGLVAAILFLRLKRLDLTRSEGENIDTKLQGVQERFSSELRQEMQNMRETLERSKEALGMRLERTSHLMHETLTKQMGESVKIVREVTEELTRVGEGQKQVIDIAKQLENLQDILKNPKQRGALGEYFLNTVLENVLPVGTYQLQYEFQDGTKVDAAIFVKDKIIPVDAKFSLENYTRLINAREQTERERYEKLFRQDLKNRIDETSKYVKPSEGTLEFAFMFIPSEGLYYDLLVNKVGTIEARDLIEYAFREKRVIAVSPTSFLAYLQTVLQGLRALQIEESAKEIRKRVEELGRHLGAYEVYFQKLGANLGTTVKTYNLAYKELSKVDKDIFRITGGSPGVKPELLDAPMPPETEK